MEQLYGWTGRFLRIDLSSGEINTTRSRDYTDSFIGGRMLASRIYWDEVSHSTGALSPENCLMIMPGPLTGTAATACSRWVMSAKSPHSYPDQYGFGNGGGFFGAALKLAGYDGLIITGRAQDTSYLLIENEKVEIKSAKGLWGLTSDETMKRLKQTTVTMPVLSVSGLQGREWFALPLQLLIREAPFPMAWVPSWALKTSKL